LGTVASTKIPAFAVTTLKVNGDSKGAMFLMALETSTVAKTHKLYPDETADLISFSAIYDQNMGSGMAVGYAGCKATKLDLKLASKTKVTASLGFEAKTETQNLTYTAADVPEDSPFIAGTGRITTYINQLQGCDFKDLTISLANTIWKDECIGSDTFVRQGSSGITVNASGTLNLFYDTSNPDTYDINQAFKAGTPVELIIYIEHPNYADSSVNVKNSMVIRIPRLFLTDAKIKAGDGRITIPLAGESEYSNYYKDIEFYVTAAKTSQY
jgi:hypothetical protein